MNAQLRADYQKCKQIIEKHSKTFALAFGQLPSPKREAVWAFYAFNRRLDDMGDLKGDRAGLKEAQTLFKRMLNGDVADDFIYRALFDVHQRYGIDEDAVMAMFSGQFKDAEKTTLQTEDDLMTYCYEVAGSVGQMLLPVLASEKRHTHHEALMESAKCIGIGMQLTNILRDVKDDYTHGRCYFSNAQMAREGLHLDAVFSTQANTSKEAYIKVWEHYEALAYANYERGLAHIELYDADSRRILLTAVMMYSEILTVAKARDYGLMGRAKVSPLRKLKIMEMAEQRLEELTCQINGSH